MLKLHWTAKFKNGEILNQFKDGKESLFLDVQNKFNELEYFNLQHIEKSLNITIDLMSGLIFINDNDWWGLDLISKKKNIRLIYFRRNRVTTKGKRDIRYYIGYQYNDNVGRNKKVILQVDNNGNIIIGS